MIKMYFDKEHNILMFNSLKFARVIKQTTAADAILGFLEDANNAGVIQSLTDSTTQFNEALLWVLDNENVKRIFDGKDFKEALKKSIAGEPAGNLINREGSELIDFYNKGARPGVGIVKKDAMQAPLVFLPKFPIDNAAVYLTHALFWLAAHSTNNVQAEANRMATEIIELRKVNPQLFDLHDLMLVSNYTDKNGNMYYIANTPKTKAAIKISVSEPWYHEPLATTPADFVADCNVPVASINIYIDPTYAIKHEYLERANDYAYIDDNDKPSVKFQSAINRALNNLFRALDVDTTILNRAPIGDNNLFRILIANAQGNAISEMAPNNNGINDWCLRATILGYTPAYNMGAVAEVATSSQYSIADSTVSPVSRNDK